jgi:hypothetical protein
MLPELTHAERGLGGATKDDIEQLSIRIYESEKYRPHTKSDYVTVLKRFYQWLKAPPEQYNSWRKKHRYPPEVDDLNSSMKASQRFYPSDLLSEDEVNSMIQAAEWIMVKGAIALVDEIGPRPGEFLNVAVWPGRSNPEDEVVSVQLRKFDGSWNTVGRLALYRTKEGAYSELPERQKGSKQQEEGG